ncbi:MAG: LytTR family transcriptional regulator [Flammeovirgaceae bacterium]|nr:LytTR family transcriptional regulator [Flammeovirgaceae bacterium]
MMFIGAFLLMVLQIRENQEVIQRLLTENKRMKKSFLEIISNRKMIKVPYYNIIFIESLSDYIKVNTIESEIVNKEKISKVYDRLPDIFLRIHRSFIIKKE